MSAKLGLLAKLYRKPAGSWIEITNVKDLTLALDKGEADATTRAAVGFKITIDSLKDVQIEFDMVWDTADASLVAFKDAFFNNTQVLVACKDGDIAVTGTQGLESWMTVVKFERKEPLAEAIMVSVALKPGYNSVAPAWVTTP